MQKKKEAAPSSANGGLQRPASRGEMVTKTFAARPEALAPDDAGAVAVSTRKIATSSRPPPPDPSGIETPASQPPARRASNLRALVAVALVGLAIGGAYLLRPKPTGGATIPNTTAPTDTHAHVPTPPTVVTAPTVTAPTTVPTTTGSAAETKPAGHLALYGDPGTRALVDGVSKGTCPLADVAVEPGPHEVRFVFDATGESSGTRQDIKPGEHVRIRADFTGATPTVRVQR